MWFFPPFLKLYTCWMELGYLYKKMKKIDDPYRVGTARFMTLDTRWMEVTSLCGMCEGVHRLRIVCINWRSKYPTFLEYLPILPIQCCALRVCAVYVLDNEPGTRAHMSMIVRLCDASTICVGTTNEYLSGFKWKIAPNERCGHLSDRGDRDICDGETREHVQMTFAKKLWNSEPLSCT